MSPSGIWRVCIDFGTASSKISLCYRPQPGVRASELVHPLQIGQAASETSPYMAQSCLLFDRGRIYFGAHAANRADETEVETELLQSFKMLLSARDLEESLNYKLARTFDASGLFSQRDTLILYIAYLMRLAESALAHDPRAPKEVMATPLRYAHPQWRAGEAANAIIASAFDQAAALPASLKEAMQGAQGIDMETARAALDKAQANPKTGCIESGVFEAQAAAECHFAFSPSMPLHILVLDVGAGTTDLTGFEIYGDDDTRAMREIENVRMTAPLACDQIDRILVALMVEKAPSEKRKGARREFWRRLSLRSRKLKETLFQQGACEATFEGKKITLRRSEFVASALFKEFRAAMLEIYTDALAKVSRQAEAAGREEIGIVLAGGGAALPFVQQITQSTRPKNSRIRRVIVQPLIPDWARETDFKPPIAEAFPQLSISIGGAIAQLEPSQARS